MKPLRTIPSPPSTRDRADHWSTEAACVDEIELMNDAHDSPSAWPWAKDVCRRCPVRDACLAEHLHERYGVWGGLDPDERAVLRGEVPPRPGKEPSAPLVRVCALDGCGATFVAKGRRRFCRPEHQLRDAARRAS